MDEFVVVERVTGRMSPVVPVMTTERLLELQREVDQVFVDPTLMEYVVRLASATRNPAEYGIGDVAKYITYGASPRASINLVLAGRALAYLRGRRYVTGQDVQDLALDVLRHRIVLSFEALSEDVSADESCKRVLRNTYRRTTAGTCLLGPESRLRRSNGPSSANRGLLRATTARFQDRGSTRG